jgi:DNA-binding MurR/RpiR family transcriptional regulator
VEELRSLMLAIARGEARITLGPKARRALGQILDLRGDPALLSITALAERLDINASTITRLARNLGYSGFGAFQKVLLDASMHPPGEFYSRQARTALGSGGTPSQGQAARLCRENQANIDRFVEGFDPAAFDAAVALIKGAPRVAVHGIRQFHSLASFLVYGLKMIRSDVSLLDANALGAAEDLAAMSAGDVLISASCAPYSGQVIATAEAAAAHDLNVVAITDRANSPLVDKSRAALFVPHETSFLSNSMACFIVAAECLINGCAAAMAQNAKAALADRDRMIKALGIEN